MTTPLLYKGNWVKVVCYDDHTTYHVLVNNMTAYGLRGRYLCPDHLDTNDNLNMIGLFRWDKIYSICQL